METQSSAPVETQRSQQQQTNSKAANNTGDEIEAPEKPLSLAELFAEPDESTETVEGAEDPDSPLETFDQVAKRLKVKPEDLYKVRVAMKDGAEALTIGELKDRVGELVEHDRRVLEFDNRRVKQEGELINARNEFRTLLGLLPKDAITPQLLEKVRNSHTEMMTQQVNMLKEVVPEWNDSKTYTQEVGEIKSYLKRWGFDSSIWDTITDHRVYKFVRDSWLRDKRIEAALAKVQKPTTQSKRPSAKGKTAAVRPSARSENRFQNRAVTQDDKIRALFSDTD